MTAGDVREVMDLYREFFQLPRAAKAAYDMAATGSNRGWGAPGAEQVDPTANPDYKEVFDCGLELDTNDPLSTHTYYAPNRWPADPPSFKPVVSQYYDQATTISLALLSAIATAIGQPAGYFADKFDKPMALLRGNYYPPRPRSATDRDFGIAPHTDYGCLTLLATDGSAGLEVQMRDHQWIPVCADPGTFVINFGEMLQMWTGGRVVATPHRVIGGSHERISIPFFFNPRFDANVAPWGSKQVLLAGEHLSKRYDQTYVHRQQTETT
jgi:isopenicillin N synthase-like dioxygenase